MDKEQYMVITFIIAGEIVGKPGKGRPRQSIYEVKYVECWEKILYKELMKVALWIVI